MADRALQRDSFMEPHKLPPEKRSLHGSSLDGLTDSFLRLHWWSETVGDFCRASLAAAILSFNEAHRFGCV